MENFWSFFSFPLNIIIAALWAGVFWMLWTSRRDNVIIRFLLSPAATVSSICLLLAGCIWIGVSGDREFVRSVIFVAVLLYVQTVLFLIILRGYRRPDGIRWRFLMIHVGLLIAIGAGVWGAPDSYELRVGLSKGDTTHEAYRLDGGRTALSYEIQLVDFSSRYASDGMPEHYEATVAVNEGEPVRILVNHPYSVSLGEDIYLANVTESGCVLQIVHEPWRYFVLLGIIMLIAGAFMLFIGGPKR